MIIYNSQPTESKLFLQEQPCVAAPVKDLVSCVRKVKRLILIVDTTQVNLNIAGKNCYTDSFNAC